MSSAAEQPRSPRTPRIVVVARPGNLARFLAPTITALGSRAEVVVVANDPGFSRWASIPGVRAEKMKRSRSTLNQGPRAIRSYLHWVALKKHDWSYLEKYAGWIPEKQRPLARFLHKSRLTKLMALRPLAAKYEKMERDEPPQPEIVDHLKELRPDLILVIPVVFQNHPDVDYLKAGVHLGIPSVAVIPSWDNLTTKGIFHVKPSAVFVWNEVQRMECVTYHGLDQGAVFTDGAPVFDAVFERKGLTSREEFCRQAKLDPNGKFVLWAATSMGGRDESAIVKELAADLPSGVSILVRPHPKYSKAWKAEEFERLPVQIWDGSRFAEDDESVGDIVNAVEHSCAVIGLSTSMFLEAAILDRPTALIKKPANGTDFHSMYLHFQYLIDSKFIEICANERAMSAWLKEVVKQGDGKSEIRRSFALSFLRPGNPDRPAAEAMANRILLLAEGLKNPESS